MDIRPNSSPPQYRQQPEQYQQAQPPQSLPPTEQAYYPPPMKKKGGFLKFLMILILIGLGTGAGYWYGHKAIKPAQNSTVTSTQNVPATPTFHLVNSVAYPVDAPTKVFTTQLGVPSGMQAVVTPSGGTNRGAEQFLTDKFNDELGRWALGTPESIDPAGEVSLLAISKSWLAAKSKVDAINNYGIESHLMTPAEKSQYVDKLKADTTECAKDTKKGFTTEDKSLNICYSFNPGKQGYKPTVIIKGYGEKEGVPMAMVGTVNIFDNTKFATQDAELKAIADALDSKLTQNALDGLNSLINALAKTKVTAETKPATTP